MADYFFGEIPGNPVLTTYVNRNAAKDAGVHQVTQQGISGNREVGANSVVVNGGYEDDADFGDVIIYTGAGGNDAATKQQIADQTFEQHGNAALIVSEENGLPVRVIRGSQGSRSQSPARGFRYDGLYRVESHWYEVGKSGFRVCRYRLLRLSSAESAPYNADSALLESVRGLGSASTGGASGAPAGASPAAKTRRTPPTGTSLPERDTGITTRIVRDTSVSNWVKTLYGYACQICDVVLDLPVGNYAEGAHIRALGLPHLGPDTVDNVLCLCPIHHVLFDKGAIYLSDSLVVHDHHNAVVGPLKRRPEHAINLGHVQYHRASVGH